MNHPGKVFLTLTAALLLLCPQIFAQEPSGEAAPPPAEQTDQDEDTNQLLQQFEKAPTLEGGTQKLYHIRNVNIHGAQYIDNSILRASSGLIPGDSIYLPSNFISTAITRLWNQRLFSDIRVGATIEGDSLDLEVFLKERPRVNYWRFEGISKSNQKDLLEKLKLNDASLSFEPESSVALGFGFRCGFLGMLHMEVIQERLEREFDLDLVTTLPSVIYEVYKTDGTMVRVDNPHNYPDPAHIEHAEEPYVKVTIVTPPDYVGNIMPMCQDRRGEFKDMQYLDTYLVEMHYEMPLNEIIYDFFDTLKSRTRGYASFDYELKEYVQSNLVKLDIMLNGEVVDALSFIIHADKAYSRARKMAEKLKEKIPRQLFEIPIQACIGGKIIARETVKAMRKDVLAKCYGGDISRKKKLLEKQKEGKKRMRQLGSVEVPQEAFMAVLKLDTD